MTLPKEHEVVESGPHLDSLAAVPQATSLAKPVAGPLDEQLLLPLQTKP